MFIKVTHSGGHCYAVLVESFRNEEGKPRQRILATIGRVGLGGEVDKLIAGLRRAQGLESSAQPQFLSARSAGDVWALWQLWHSLALDDLAHAWRRSRSQIDVLAYLRLMVFNRLCDPGSKLGVLRWWDTVALPQGFGCEVQPEHQALLRAMDVLDTHSSAIGDRLAELMRPLIDTDLSVVFYDLTTVRVHGLTQLGDDVRQYGLSKEGGIARQFMLSVVQTADGLPMAHEVHPGNTAEAKTLLPMLKKLLGRWPIKRVVLIADRGLLNVGNLRALHDLERSLKAQGRDIAVQFVLAVPAARYGDFKDELARMHAVHQSDLEGQSSTDASPGASEVPDAAQVPAKATTPEPQAAKATEVKAAEVKAKEAQDKPTPAPSALAWVDEIAWTLPQEQCDASTADASIGDGSAQPRTTYRLVVAHDPEAAARRKNARSQQIKELVELGQSLGGRLDDQDSGVKRRGRPLSDSGAKARFYNLVKEANLAHLIKVDLKAQTFCFSLDEQRLRYLELLDGKLLLVTNTPEAAPEVVARYKSLADIERGFRTLKGELLLGPVYHRLPKRIRAHALVCFIALVLHRVMRLRLRAAHRAESPATLLAQLTRVQQQTVRLASGDVLCGLTQLDAQQRDLFEALEVPQPQAGALQRPKTDSVVV